MLHGGHTADSGPSSRSSAANAAGTGFSEATASFIAANASPFINPTELIGSGVKVPDPRNTRRTCSTTITCRMTVPVVNFGDQGKLLIVMDADPLSQLPIWLSREPTTSLDSVGPQTSLTANTDVKADKFYFNELSENMQTSATQSDRCDPKSWGQIYSKYGAADLFSQTKALGEMSVRHRIVGCGMRANVGVDTNIGRGTIEAGQFVWGDTKDGLTRINERFHTATNRHGYWGCDVDSSDAAALRNGLAKQKGVNGMIRSCGYSGMRQNLRGSRTQDWGILDADQGACVRWTDSNGYEFQKTINRNICVPTRYFYANGVESIVAGSTHQPAPVANVRYVDCNAPRYSTVNGKNVALATKANKSPLCNPVRWLQTGVVSDTADTSTQLVDYFIADTETLCSVAAGSYEDGTNTIGNTDISTLIDEKLHFDNGLYIDVTGVSTTQWVNVDFIWHVEFEPKNYALMRGINSPVDPRFDEVSSMLTDSAQFPIVVKGHSFFSSLWHGIKAAVGFGSKLASGASRMMQASGNPELMGIGSAMDSGLGLVNSLYGQTQGYAASIYDLAKRQRLG